MTKLIVALALLFSALAAAQNTPDALKPPKGSQLAIVVFEDLQCPQCSHAAPVIEQAGKTYKIPVVVHDFPLPLHNWSYVAAVNARYFDSLSKQTGDAYRAYIFQHQLEIIPPTLRGFTERFATEHKVSVPFVVDPQGKFAAAVNADRDLGKSLSVDHTPTIYIVSGKNPAKPFVEVKEYGQLYQTIDAMK